MNSTRAEGDTFGEVQVPADRYWGAQTQRSLINFEIGEERMPMEVIKALALIKMASATVHRKSKQMDERVAQAIEAAAQEVIDGRIGPEHFPLVVWQTGSGTQSNMNVNEVISNRAIELLNGQMGSKSPVHPNDHVNRSQSSNDSFPTAMHLATSLAINSKLLPSLSNLSQQLSKCIDRFRGIIKIGRTHLQDATPLALSDEFSAFKCQVDSGISRLQSTLPRLYQLAQGGTAVGTVFLLRPHSHNVRV